MSNSDSKRVEIRISLAQPAILDKTINAITKWKARRRHSHLQPRTVDYRELPNPPLEEKHSSRLPTEIYEQILSWVGFDILLYPAQVDRLKHRSHFLEYFRFVEFE